MFPSFSDIKEFVSSAIGNSSICTTVAPVALPIVTVAAVGYGIKKIINNKK